MPGSILAEPILNLRTEPDGPSTRGSHRLQSATVCETHWFLRYMLGYRPALAKPWLTQGTLFHLNAAYYYVSKLSRPPDWSLSRTLSQRLRDLAPHNEDWRQTSIDCFSAYKTFFANEQFVPVDVECERYATLGELGCAEFRDEIVTCRNDLEVSLPETGEVIVIDFKTQGMQTSNDEAWKIDLQAAHNLLVTRTHYKREKIAKNVRGFMIVRATRKPPYKFDRHIVRVAPEIYGQLPNMLQFAVAEEFRIRDLVQLGKKVQRMGVIRGACYHRYGACEFADVCSAADIQEKKRILESDFVRLAK